MQNPTKPELEQLVDTFRAVTEEDLTEPLLRKMRTLAGKSHAKVLFSFIRCYRLVAFPSRAGRVLFPVLME